MNALLLGVLLYVGLQLAVGIAVSRRVHSEEDYLLAGRSLGLGLAMFSLFATWFGSESCISATSEIYTHGLAGGAADPFGYGLCIVFMGLVFAAPLWRRGLTTLADLFHSRYSPLVERVAVLVMAPTSVLWAAAQIRGFGQVLDATAGMGVPWAITFAAAVAVAYTVMGGLRADVITDVIQGVVLIVGLLLLFLVVHKESDGIGVLLREMPGERWRLFGGPEVGWLETVEAWAIPICGSVVAQELAARTLAVRSATLARKAALMGGGLYLVVGVIPALLGLVGPSVVPGLENPEQLLPELALRHLPGLLYILFAGALISAILSTVDSALLAAASLISHNLVAPLHPRATDQDKLRWAKWGVAGCGLAAYSLALSAENIFGLVQDASALGSAGVFVILVFGLFTRIGGTASAVAALLVGLGIYVTGNYLLEDYAYSFLTSLAAATGAYLALAVRLK